MLITAYTVVLAGCVVEAPPPEQHTGRPEAQVPAAAGQPAAEAAPEPLIRSRSDFDRAAEAGWHPLDKLEPAQLARLRESLVFDAGGIVSLDHALARAALGVDAYIDLMHELGVPFDHDDHRFAGLTPPHPSAPRPGREYCPVHGPPRQGPAAPPPMIPDVSALEAATTRGDVPLAELPPDVLYEFMDTLGTNAAGQIHSLDLALLEKHLGAEEAADIVRLIGGDVATDYANMYCAKAGSCAPRFGWICIGLNCTKP